MGLKLQWRGQAVPKTKMRKTHVSELETSWNHSLTSNTHQKTLPDRLKPTFAKNMKENLDLAMISPFHAKLVYCTLKQFQKLIKVAMCKY